jgi:preprotein translocase subunit SecA
MFEEMINSIRETTVQLVFTARIRGEGAPQRERVAKVTGESAGDETLRKEPVRKDKKPGRNDPCPCGSGKKYKKCCGINE